MIERLAALSSLEVTDDTGDATGFARLTADGARVLIPVAGVLDLETERARLSKRIAAIEDAAAKSERKLAGEGFLAKAPAEVVEQERRRLAAAKEEAGELAAQLQELG